MGENEIRHPLLKGEIDPFSGGRRSGWVGRSAEISICIAGAKTDCLNRGTISSRNMIPDGGKNTHLCPVRHLVKLWKICPPKCHMDGVWVSESWMSGKPIKPDRAVSLLGVAVSQQCLHPSAFSIHSLRAGSATALYRATGDIGLVARIGRCGTSSISPYLMEVANFRWD